MLKVVLTVAIYLGEVAAVSVLADSGAAYEGWGSFGAAEPMHVAFALCVLCGVSALLSSRPATVREYFFWWAFATILVPSWVVADWSSFFAADVLSRGTQLVTVGFLTCVLVSKVLPRLAPVRVLLAPRQFYAFVFAALLLSIAFLLLSLGPPDLGSLSLSGVYEKRADYVASVSGPDGYIMSWTSQVLVPAALITGLRFRRPVLTLTAVASGVMVYAWVGSKNTILLMALSAVVYALVRRENSSSRALQFPTIVAALAIMPVFVYVLTHSDELVYVVGRRALLVPAWNMMAHVQYGLSQGVEGDMGGWLLRAITGQGVDPYSYGSLVIGDLFRPGDGLNANSHFLSYPMQWNSMFAVFVVGLMAGVILWLLDLVAQGRDASIAVALGSIVAFNLSESYLHTGLVTGGILLALLFLFLAPPAAARGARDGSTALHSRLGADPLRVGN